MIFDGLLFVEPARVHSADRLFSSRCFPMRRSCLSRGDGRGQATLAISEKITVPGILSACIVVNFFGHYWRRRC